MSEATGLAIEIVLFVVTWLLMIELYRRKAIKLDAAKLIDEQTLRLLQASLAMAESARVSRRETTIAKESVENKLDANAEAIKEQVKQVPQKTAELVGVKLKENDSFH